MREVPVGGNVHERMPGAGTVAGTPGHGRNRRAVFARKRGFSVYASGQCGFYPLAVRALPQLRRLAGPAIGVPRAPSIRQTLLFPEFETQLDVPAHIQKLRGFLPGEPGGRNHGGPAGDTRRKSWPSFYVLLGYHLFRQQTHGQVRFVDQEYTFPTRSCLRKPQRTDTSPTLLFPASNR